MARSSSFDSRWIALAAILGVFGIPALAIMQPILADLIPLAYILSVFCLGTFCARYLLNHHHGLKMEEIRQGAELARLDAERYRAASRLLEDDDPVERKVREITARADSAGDETDERDDGDS